MSAFQQHLSLPACRSRVRARDARFYRSLYKLLTLEDGSDTATIASEASSHILHATRSDSVELYIHDEVANVLVAIGSSVAPGLNRRTQTYAFEEFRLSDNPLAAQVLLSDRSFISSDLESEDSASFYRRTGTRSLMLCRIRARAGRVAGVLQTTSTEKHYFGPASLRYAEAAARCIGLLIDSNPVLPAQLRLEQPVRSFEPVELLTPREREVVNLIARGFTNDEIAEQLVLVVGTVSNHVEHILRKLGFRNRVQIATWAVLNGLWSPEETASDRRTAAP